MKGAYLHTPPPWGQFHEQVPSYPSNSGYGYRNVKVKRCLNSNQSPAKLSRTLSVSETHPWFPNRTRNAQLGWLTCSTAKAVAYDDDETPELEMASLLSPTMLETKHQKMKTRGMMRKSGSDPSSLEWRSRMKPLLLCCPSVLSWSWSSIHLNSDVAVKLSSPSYLADTCGSSLPARLYERNKRR